MRAVGEPRHHRLPLRRLREEEGAQQTAQHLQLHPRLRAQGAHTLRPYRRRERVQLPQLQLQRRWQSVQFPRPPRRREGARREARQERCL